MRRGPAPNCTCLAVQTKDVSVQNDDEQTVTRFYYVLQFFFFFFMESTENAICLICKEQIATAKEYDVKRHSLTKHREQYEKYQGGESKQRTKHLLRGL